MQKPIPVIGMLVKSAHIDSASNSLITAEPKLCASLAAAANHLPLTFYIFQASDFHAQDGVLEGFCLLEGKWKKKLVPLPDAVYDRLFTSSSQERFLIKANLRKLSQVKRFVRLNAPLPAKLAVHHCLKQTPELAAALPLTVPCRSTADLLRSLDHCPDGIIIKPSAGMQGKGVIQIIKTASQGWRLTGRTLSNKPFSLILKDDKALGRKLDPLLHRRRFILQPFLKLSDPQGYPFDIRSLVQKNGNGEWEITGIAIRLGNKDNITSNLHGGGTAVKLENFLSSRFTAEQIEDIRQQVVSISLRCANALEQYFGRFGELAFDFGLTEECKLWFLEANSKPGRSCFHEIHDHNAQLRAVLHPLLYGNYLFRTAKQNNPLVKSNKHLIL